MFLMAKPNHFGTPFRSWQNKNLSQEVYATLYALDGVTEAADLRPRYILQHVELSHVFYVTRNREIT